MKNLCRRVASVGLLTSLFAGLWGFVGYFGILGDSAISRMTSRTYVSTTVAVHHEDPDFRRGNAFREQNIRFVSPTYVCKRA
jgi:hypothetical protein